MDLSSVESQGFASLLLSMNTLNDAEETLRLNGYTNEDPAYVSLRSMWSAAFSAGGESIKVFFYKDREDDCGFYTRDASINDEPVSLFLDSVSAEAAGFSCMAIKASIYASMVVNRLLASVDQGYRYAGVPLSPGAAGAITAMKGIGLAAEGGYETVDKQTWGDAAANFGLTAYGVDALPRDVLDAMSSSQSLDDFRLAYIVSPTNAGSAAFFLRSTEATLEAFPVFGDASYIALLTERPSAGSTPLSVANEIIAAKGGVVLGQYMSDGIVDTVVDGRVRFPEFGVDSRVYGEFRDFVDAFEIRVDLLPEFSQPFLP